MTTVERFLWDHLDEWIEGTPSGTVVDRLERSTADADARDVIRYLAPALLTVDRGPLRSEALQQMGRLIESEEAQRVVGRRVVAALDGAGIDHLFIKGMDLRYRLYDLPTRRPSNDVDLLVDPTRYREAVALLASIGGRRHEPADDDGLAREQESSWSFDGANVDLHRSLVQIGRGPIDFAELRERSEEVAVDDFRLRVPCREHAAALCLIHIGRHEGATEFVHLRHGIDVYLIGRRWNVDWSAVAACAARWRCRRLAGAGLWTWRDAFGDRLPEAAFDALDPGPIARTCARWSRRTLGHPRVRASRVGRGAQLLLKWIFAEDARDRRWLLRESRRRALAGR